MTDAPKKKKRRNKHQPKGLLILHEDKDLIVVDKAPGLLTMATDRESEQTAYYRLTDYVRKGNPKSRERVYIVHRLDREVSGILIFARNIEVKKALQAQWPEVQKHYLALVKGIPAKPEGVFQSYLVEEGVHRVHSTKDPTRGKLSETAYTILDHARGVTLLDINLLSGRKHQIRVHLSENGLPILGDKKYGGTGGGARRLALHAKSLTFIHPRTGEPHTFETRIPHLFSQYAVGGRKNDQPAPKATPDPAASPAPVSDPVKRVAPSEGVDAKPAKKFTPKKSAPKKSMPKKPKLKPGGPRKRPGSGRGKA